jgi:carboxyl-terminal processing protease
MSQSQDWAQAIDGIVQSLEETDSLVLDLRGNRGGLISNVDYISGRFASSEKAYAEIQTKDGPGSADFSAPLSNLIKPAGTRYTRPIVLLTNEQTISGGEWFTLALRSQGHVTHSGGATNGAFSLSLERTLINGWRYSMSVQKVTDMKGICYEGIGISPALEHVRFNTAEEISAGKDTQLEYAVDLCE